MPFMKPYMVKLLREQFPPGTRVRLESEMNNPQPIPTGMTGTVQGIDDAGQLLMEWDNGRGLSLVPGEDDFTVVKPQKLKLYMPLALGYYEKNDWGDYEDEELTLSDDDAVGYADTITGALERESKFLNTPRGFMEYYNRSDGVDAKVQSLHFKAEARNGKLWGVAECMVSGELNGEELAKLKDYIAGQASDGFGESVEQHEIRVGSMELYAHLWQAAGWSIQTEQECFAPKLAKGLPELCFSTLPSTGALICIKRGESGYYPSDWNTPDRTQNRQIADEQNQRLGVTPAQEEAMVVCIATEGGENVAKKQTSGNLALEQQRVIVIPAHDELVARKLRVAAYARVSSSSEDQLNSYRVQNQYYSELISNNPDWEMVDIYADEGITGTSVEKREDFQRMIKDCRKGKIDRILVKSISRFARNTKDCLAAVRELKELGVSVQFEEQGIDTSKVSSEMVTAIMASLAQKQSESISGNVKWGVQKRIQDKTFVTCKEPYGYRLVDRRLCIVESEAIIVRMIYEKYLAGISMEFIRDQLNVANIPFRENEKQHRWTRKAISYILANEKYIGDSLWQKTYSGDTFPYKQRKNKGEKEQYYVENTHQAIVEKSVWHAVAELRMQRAGEKHPEDYYAPSAFRKKVLCGCCSSMFRLRQNRGCTYWSCRQHDIDRNSCPNSQIPETVMQEAFCRLYYKLKHHGSPIFAQMLSNLQKIRYSRMLWSEDVISLNKKISDILSQVQFLTQLQQAGGVDPDTFITSNNKLSEQLRRLKQEKARLLDTDSDDLADRTRDLMDALEDGPDFLDGFDAELFDALVDKIIVDSNERLRFRLKNGLELPEQIERTRR